MTNFSFKIDQGAHTLKFQQLVEIISNAINSNQLKAGEMLPSVNQLIKESGLSRDTVFKAYGELKQRGLVESVPNRGYFVSKKTSKVFLFLDTFKAYKEVVYGSFSEHLKNSINVDLHFHHYNIRLFETILNDSIGKYSKYIVMNFDHPKVSKIINRIPPEKLLVIDWKINAEANHSYVAQDFGEPVFNSLKNHVERVKKYQKFILFYPPFTYHPKEAIVHFQRFCDAFNVPSEVIYDLEKFEIRKGDLYFLVSDRTLAKFLDQCSEKNLVLGKDVGVISYNETPMKKYVKDGITVISTDFAMMGRTAAEFVNSGNAVQAVIPTKLLVRSSF